CFALDEPAVGDSAGDPLLEFLGSLDTEHVLEQCRDAGALSRGPGEALVELGERKRQPEEREGPTQSLKNDVVVPGTSFVGFAFRLCVSLGHPHLSSPGVGVGSATGEGGELTGRRSYSVRSRGLVRT